VDQRRTIGGSSTSTSISIATFFDMIYYILTVAVAGAVVAVSAAKKAPYSFMVTR
jgi:hypothetical protein